MNLFYRGLITSAAILCSTAASADLLNVIVCEDCRSTEHSRDFGNFAFNQTYGINSWMLEDEVIIMNLEGGWVHVDLTFELEENIISNIADFIGLDLGVPTGRIIIETMTDTTSDDRYIIDLDMVDTMGPLPVGNDEPSPSIIGGGGDSSGGGDTGGGGVGAGGAGSGSTGGGSGGGSSGGCGSACTSAGDGEWHCVPY